MNKRGFTLIEAVIAISIILAMAIAGFNRIADAQKSERDAQRRADLSEIKSRLTNYYFDNQFEFPDQLSAVASEDSPLPVDPLDQSDYIYTVDADIDGENNDYTLEARIESPLNSESSITVSVSR